MNNIDHIPDNVLKELAQGSHPPVEMLQAYAREELNSESHKKVSEHLDACQECTELLSRINDMLKEEKDFVAHGPEKDKSVAVPPILAAKARLVAAINAGKDKMVEEIAQTLLPKSDWNMIGPAILVMKNQDQFIPTQTRDDMFLAKAAFGADLSEEEKERYEKILSVIRLVEIVTDLLQQRCDDDNSLEQQLPQCLAEGLDMIGLNIKLTQQETSRIKGIIYKYLSKHVN